MGCEAVGERRLVQYPRKREPTTRAEMLNEALCQIERQFGTCPPPRRAAFEEHVNREVWERMRPLGETDPYPEEQGDEDGAAWEELNHQRQLRRRRMRRHQMILRKRIVAEQLRLLDRAERQRARRQPARVRVAQRKRTPRRRACSARSRSSGRPGSADDEPERHLVVHGAVTGRL